ncbi:integrase, catalytic region, zinc finger, CCHC-type containing protein [Tanacetum coccineum]
MAFISTTFAPRYPPTNNQLKTSSNPMNQATIQDGRVIVQNVQGRQTQSYGRNSTKGHATGTGVIRYTGNFTANQSKVIRCYNGKCEGHFSRHWEIIDSGIDASVMNTTTIFQSYDSEAFDSDYDEAPTTQATFMANLSSYGSVVLSDVPNNDTYHNNTVFEQSVQEMEYSEQLVIDDDSNIEITSDSNVISSNQLDCTSWEHWATMWDEYAQKPNELGHVVFILQPGKVKYRDGTLAIQNALFASKMFINRDVPEILAFRQRFGYVKPRIMRLGMKL